MGGIDAAMGEIYAPKEAQSTSKAPRCSLLVTRLATLIVVSCLMSREKRPEEIPVQGHELKGFLKIYKSLAERGSRTSTMSARTKTIKFSQVQIEYSGHRAGENENSNLRHPDPIGISRNCPPQADKHANLKQKLGKLTVFVQAPDNFPI
jgi:hypothetical protein